MRARHARLGVPVASSQRIGIVLATCACGACVLGCLEVGSCQWRSSQVVAKSVAVPVFAGVAIRCASGRCSAPPLNPSRTQLGSNKC
eukprot:8429503-Alexandrium_andersonii.AAC.1